MNITVIDGNYIVCTLNVLWSQIMTVEIVNGTSMSVIDDSKVTLKIMVSLTIVIFYSAYHWQW